jgi:hypothetical protein
MDASVPDELRQRILAEATEILQVGAAAVIRCGWRIKGEVEADKLRREQEHGRMLAAWGV